MQTSFPKLQKNNSTMDVDMLAAIGALVQQQNRDIIRLQHAVERRGREREEGETELYGSDSGSSEGLNMGCMTS